MGLLKLLMPGTGMDLVKAEGGPSVAAAEPVRDVKSWQVDPFDFMASVTHREKPSSLTFDHLRAMAYRCDVISAILQTRVNQVASFADVQQDRHSFGFTIGLRDLKQAGSKAADKQGMELINFIQNCGVPGYAPDNFETFLRKFVRDSLIYDAAAFEIVPNRKGQPAFFTAVDATTIRLATEPKPELDQFGMKDISQPYGSAFRQALEQYQQMMRVQTSEGEVPAKYVQLLDGTVKTTYAPGELYYGIRNPRSDLMVGGYGHSELEMLIGVVTSYLWAEEYNRRIFSTGCVAGDTLLHTDQGLRMLRDLYEENEGFTRQMAWSEGDTTFRPMGRTWNGSEWVAYDVVASGMKRACRTVFEDGSDVTSSPEHQFLTLRDGELVRVQWTDLQVGDVVPQSREALTFSERPDTSCCVEGRSGSRSLYIEEATPELWEVLGWMVGDGTLNTHTTMLENGREKRKYAINLYYAPGEEAVKDRHVATLAQYGVWLGEYRRGGEWGSAPLYALSASHVNFYEYLRDVLGMCEGTAPTKRVPTTLFRESPECRAAFLSGLFGADGHTKSVRGAKGGARTPYLTSTSRGLIEDVQQVLWSLGIASAVEHLMGPGDYENGLKHDLWRLRVRDCERFYASVGFASPNKGDGTRTPSYASRKDGGTVPLALRQRVARALLQRDPDLQAFLSDERVAIRLLAEETYQDRYNRGSVSRSRISEWCSRVGETAFTELLSYRWVAVRELVDTGLDVLMFDVRQEHERHQYSIGNCIISNSIPKGILNLKGDMPEDQLKAFRREWTNLIAGVSNSWRTPVINAEDIEYIQLQGSNRDMEYMQWIQFLLRIGCAVYMIDPAEINFDMPRGLDVSNPMIETSGEAKLRASKDRGLKPLLRFVERAINEGVIWKIDPDFQFRFMGLDSKSSDQQLADSIQSVNTFKTLNEVRTENDLEPVEGGDTVLNPQFIALMEQQQAAAQQNQLMKLAQSNPDAALVMQGIDPKAERLKAKAEAEATKAHGDAKAQAEVEHGKAKADATREKGKAEAKAATKGDKKSAPKASSKKDGRKGGKAMKKAFSPFGPLLHRLRE